MPWPHLDNQKEQYGIKSQQADRQRKSRYLRLEAGGGGAEEIFLKDPNSPSQFATVGDGGQSDERDHSLPQVLKLVLDVIDGLV